jgi:hypothetical protein
MLATSALVHAPNWQYCLQEYRKEPEMFSFLNRHQNRQDKRSSKLTQLTLNTFFDEHYLLIFTQK